MSNDWKSPSSELIFILNRFNINGWQSPGGTDKDAWHNYTGIYEHLLSPYRKSPGRLLEIGCRFGGSSLLWHTMLPKFLICMLDIENIVDPTIWKHMNYQRYQFNLIDAYQHNNVELLKGMYPEGFDVIIDDAGHTLEQQCFTIENYLQLVRPGGVLIIEDIQSIDYIQKFIEITPDQYKDNIEVFDNRDTKGRYDDVIFSIKL